MAPPPASSQEDDSDLDDLLTHKDNDVNGTSNTHKKHVRSGGGNAMKWPNSGTGIHAPNKIMAMCSLLCFMITENPKISIPLTVVLLIVLLVGMTMCHGGSMTDPYQKVWIHNDYSKLTGVDDMNLGQIDHWCIFGADDKCQCEDPLEPSSHSEVKNWLKAHKHNKQAILDAQLPPKTNSTSPFVSKRINPDIVFLGDGTIEEWAGRSWFQTRSDTQIQHTHKVFATYFSKEGGGRYEGLPLGIAGDTAPNVLWRLMHGEIPDGFHPKVWWLAMGPNDLGRTGCSEEVALLGILRVVQQIRSMRPGAKIVINGILPTLAQATEWYKRSGSLGVRIGDSHAAPGVYPDGSNNMNQVKDDGSVWYKSQTPEALHKLTLRSRPDFRNRKGLWPGSIEAINSELKRYCKEHDDVTYFEVPEAVLLPNQGGYSDSSHRNKEIDVRKMRDGHHLTTEAYKVWFQTIVNKMDAMFEKDN